MIRIFFFTITACIIAAVFPPGLLVFAFVALQMRRKKQVMDAAIARHEARQRAEAEYAYLMRVRKAWS